MDLMRYDFTAPAGAHFGKLKSIAQLLAEIPNPVDYWTASSQSVTQAGGLVTEWTGAQGRKLVQATAARQPTLQGSEILFGDGAGAAKAALSLSGTALGAVTDLTIAGRFRLPTSALTVDNHQMFGQQTGTIFRMAYRYTSANNYLRFDINTPSVTNIDHDLPAGVEAIPVVLTVTGGTALRIVTPWGGTTATLPAQQTLNYFTVGSAVDNPAKWPGWVNKFGIWKTAATDAQIATLLSWLG